ncbi:hypothetical protein PPBDW_I21444 [Photobacterium kishitanii]|nr:hypothetical protein PPBDW_I21444 [Photobacterium kishitanii]
MPLRKSEVPQSYLEQIPIPILLTRLGLVLFTVYLDSYNEL